MPTVPRWFGQICLLDNGRENEQVVLIEELSELIKEITKDIRDKGSKERVAEELGDVYICMKTCQMLFDIEDDDIQNSVNQKIGRYLSKRASGDTK